MSDNSKNFQQQVEQALKNNTALSIHGARSHHFLLGDYAEAEVIDMTSHHGIIDYQPSELTLTARAGTPLNDIRAALAEQHQRLPTDFPQQRDDATLGGAVAIGHSGSGRPFLGAIRDHVLGVHLLTGSGETVRCGGQVMKNVAGYDVSRLLAGSRGTLGIMLDITLKVLPAPEQQITLAFDMDENAAIRHMNELAGRSLPINACAYVDGQMLLRLEGTQSGIAAAQQKLGAEWLPDSPALWDSLQRQTHEFFTPEQALWRIIVPATAPRLELENEHQSLIDWCGGLRWIHADEITQSDFIHISNLGGYLENYRGATPTRPQDLMTPRQRDMQQRIQRAFDPANIFNPQLSV
jgi:glycolate oxidase FAD binding subunit